jgi:signal transduction histidine kinase/CheY-like chemotaxis protein
MLGYQSTAELLEVDLEALYVDPAGHHGLLRQFRDADRIQDAEVEWRRRDGHPVTLRLRGQPIRDAEGRFQWFEMFAEDVTAQRAVEAQLRHAQKMEAVGQLSGGIAHDFNNLLSVIITYAQFAMDQLPEADPLRDDIKEIHDAGRLAADLTRQLLAFSRQQILEPQVISLNGVLDGVEKMLRRLLGENIAIEVRRAQGLGSVLADPGQMEQVIINLAVNARDAMPDGGKLTIETGNVAVDAEYAERHVSVTPGRYVLLSVTDTGSGMSAETRDRIFEPFFTTKEKGKGTGLGLATVYGIVKQSGGNIWVYSEPGEGTTFKTYLPRVDAAAAEIRDVHAEAGATANETVLIAEDEDGVRRAAERILEGAGYRVLTAADGDAALRLCEQHQDEIHLLLTDVVMPRMSGRDLELRVRALKPRVKVLFMSGYADNAIVHHGVLDPGTRFIGKPFSVAELRRKVREALDET